MSIAVEALCKSFGSVQVLKSITETFASSEFSVLLGASGCGKTTTLRCIAGLERPTSGAIEINGRRVYSSAPPVNVPVEQRRLSMVFQSYAIWPHMTVFQNVSLPLEAAGVPRVDIGRRVKAALDMVGLGALSDRPATNVSGGQQQRVALARCVVSDAPVILMDEPLSNLDAKLRVEMRAEIKDLQRSLGRTIIFVTHDQEEALSLADTVYVFREGEIIQRGAPKAIYDHPATRYVAEFLGKANIFSMVERDGRDLVIGGSFRVPMPAEGPTSPPSAVCIRPEKWRLVDGAKAGALRGLIKRVSFIGDKTEYVIDTQIGALTAVELSTATRMVDEPIGLTVDPGDLRYIANG